MFKRNSEVTKSVSSLFLTTLCLFFSVSSAYSQTPADGAINTSRSNLGRGDANDAARLDGRIDNLEVKLGRAAGTEPPGARLQGQISDVSKQNGKFSLGLLPAGRYELRITMPMDATDGASRQSGGTLPDDTWMKSLKVTLNGVQGGPIEKDLALSSPATDVPQSDAKKTGALQNQIGGLSSGQQMRARSQTIPFTADGKSVVSGTIAGATGASGGK